MCYGITAKISPTTADMEQHIPDKYVFSTNLFRLSNKKAHISLSNHNFDLQLLFVLFNNLIFIIG